MTNYEKIKAMSVEEMAEFLDRCFTDGCENFCNADINTCKFPFECKMNIAQWLESEAEE